jgi:hypothetical protein
VVDGKWAKLNNLSFSGNGVLNNGTPSIVTAFDSEDSSSPYFIIDGNGQAGVTSASSFTPTDMQTSANNWNVTSYTRQVGFTPSTFLDYVKSRKDYTTITDLTEIAQKGIYYVNGNITISNNPPAFDFVLLVNGTATIDLPSGDFNKQSVTTASKAIAILANNITIGNNMANAYGIFVTNASSGIFDTGTNAALGLKVRGNISAGTITNNRTNSDTSKPSIFVVQDPGAFMTLLPYLSISKYDQTIQ